MKRKFDPGMRIIKYVNRRKMLYATMAFLVGTAGIYATFYMEPLMWPVTVFGYYGAIILFQYPNLDIHYTSRKYRLWWGPFFPVFRRKGDFSNLKQVQVEYKLSQSPVLGIVMQTWHVNIIYKKKGYSFINSFASKKKALELAYSLAADLDLKALALETKGQNTPREIKRKFFRKAG